MPSDRPGRMIASLVVVVGSVILGLLVARSVFMAVGVAVAVLFAMLARAPKVRAVGIGVMVLGYLNAIPGIDFTLVELPLGLRYDDVFLVVLLGLGIVWSWGDAAGPATKRLRILLLLFGAYWLAVVLMTSLTSPVSPLMAVLYGRDLLAIGISLSVAAASVSEGASEALVDVILVGAGIFAIAHIAQTLIGIDMSWAIHPYKIGGYFGVGRLYARIEPVAAYAFLLSFARMVLVPSGRARVILGVSATLQAVEVVLQFTRANYIGMIVALAVGMVLLARSSGSRRLEVRTALVALGLGSLAGAAWIASGVRSVRTWVLNSPYFTRLISVPGDVAAQTGTFGYRVDLYGRMLEVLGGRWPLGLGFLHPAIVYVSALPQGSVRNNDTGLLGVLMTMGVAGVVLVCLPLAAAVIWGWDALRGSKEHARALGWAAMTFGVWVAATALSLGFLSYGNGLCVTALAVGSIAAAHDYSQPAESL